MPHAAGPELVSLVLLLSLQQGCSRRATPAAPEVPGTTLASAAASTSRTAASTTTSTAPAAQAPAAPASGLPPPTPSASSAPASLPRVRVINIGMHIGGGPNDDLTKAPIKRSALPHFDSFRRCFALVDPAKRGDFGVDLHIPAGGGRAQVRLPRTALRGPGFSQCMVGVFESIEFEPLPRGVTVVSYSLAFVPE